MTQTQAVVSVEDIVEIIAGRDFNMLTIDFSNFRITLDDTETELVDDIRNLLTLLSRTEILDVSEPSNKPGLMHYTFMASAEHATEEILFSPRSIDNLNSLLAFVDLMISENVIHSGLVARTN